MNIERVRAALGSIRSAGWDYYDGAHVWCRFCYVTRPSARQDMDLDWHAPTCIYRIACEEDIDAPSDEK